MSLFHCPDCGAGYIETKYTECVVCGFDFTRRPMIPHTDTDEHSPYYERKSKEDSQVIAAWCVIGMLVIFAIAALWKAYS